MTNRFQQFLVAIGYNISEGSEFLWKCYGDNARYLDYNTEDFHVSAVYDTKTLEVYEASISSMYSGDLGYKWHNPDYLTQYQDEAKSRNVIWDKLGEDHAWAITDCYDDILDKIVKILAGEEYDKRVVLSLDLDEDLRDKIQAAADLDGITIDEFFERLLTRIINEQE